MKIIKLLYFLIPSFFSICSCIHTINKDVTLNTSLNDDTEYVKILDQNTKQAKVINNFETKYVISVTYLSPSFRSAFSKRYEKIFEAPHPFLEEGSNKIGFFVTIFVNNDIHFNIANQELWNIQLKINNQMVGPSLIKMISTKKRWKPFFKSINKWTKEYIILFDASTVSLSDNLIKQQEFEFLIANSDAKIKLIWGKKT